MTVCEDTAKSQRNTERNQRSLQQGSWQMELCRSEVTTGRGIRMGRKRCNTQSWLGSLIWRDHVGHLHVDEGIILNTLQQNKTTIKFFYMIIPVVHAL
jgi:hypothetical protein